MALGRASPVSATAGQIMLADVERGEESSASSRSANWSGAAGSPIPAPVAPWWP